MFENIVVQPNFSHFFLQKLLGKFSSLSDLQSLDEELFRNLMFLKTFHGDARDLMLSFSITEDVLGVQSDVDLCPNGSELEVTSNNKLRYVYQMANYRLNTKIKKQCDAFLRGASFIFFFVVVFGTRVSTIPTNVFLTFLNLSSSSLSLSPPPVPCPPQE